MVKFVILHHGACEQRVFHYVISAEGRLCAPLRESQAGAHARAIDVALRGDLDACAPGDGQIEALRALLLRLKLRYPAIEVGGHRQVRGQRTTCPGRHFPLTRLREWAAAELLVERDVAVAEEVFRQYRPRD